MSEPLSEPKKDGDVTVYEVEVTEEDFEDPIDVPRTAQREDDVRQATQRVARIYEDYVRRYPYQWFNFHDFWAVPAVAARTRPARER